MKFVTAPVGQGEGRAPVADRGEQGRCVVKSGRDDVDDVAFALNLAVDHEHGGRQDDAALLGESADLLFHLIVLLRARGLSLADAVAVLAARHAG